MLHAAADIRNKKKYQKKSIFFLKNTFNHLQVDKNCNQSFTLRTNTYGTHQAFSYFSRLAFSSLL
jgi:hypothetical protein